MKLLDKLNDYNKPREKALHYGVEVLENSELLAIILNTGTKDEDVLALSKRLIEDNGGIVNLSKCSIQELVKQKGIGLSKAVLLKAAFELKNRVDYQSTYQMKLILNIDDAATYFHKYIGSNEKEQLFAMYLNSKKEIIKFSILAKGTSKDVNVSITEILSEAVRYLSSYVIVGHNHPSNIVLPSKADLYFTEQLTMGALTLGINVIDHLIIGNNNYYSLKQKSKYILDKT